MAVIAFKQYSLLCTDYILGNSGTVTPPSGWKVALATNLVSAMARDSVWSATVSGTNINEIGSTTAAGYSRKDIARSIAQAGVDWGASSWDNTAVGGGASMTGDEVTFGPFSGAPDPNGAKSWVVTDGATLNAGYPYFGGDTGATRTFANGDTEKVTPTLKVG